MKYPKKIIGWLLFLPMACTEHAKEPLVFHALGEMAGEATHNSIILQSRLTAVDSMVHGKIPGIQGVARFEWSSHPNLSKSQKTQWIKARPENDFIVKTTLTGLSAGIDYFYRLEYGLDSLNIRTGPIRKFRTLPGKHSDQAVDFVVTSCFNFHRFHYGQVNRPNSQYKGPDKHMGYPALEVIHSLNPDFVVFTGDNVYYDTPQTDSVRAKTEDQMRAKWHQQFAQQRFKALFQNTATFWEKDDHDHRFNDSDTLNDFSPSSRYKNYTADSLSFKLPTHRSGIKIFREQVPVVDPGALKPVTYRTHRLNKDLQVWFTENRDYRSPNTLTDGPQKTIWGNEQKQWLKQTLMESDAKYKLLISPTPLVGPDDSYKRDNHVNHQGFRNEGRDFLEWIMGNKPGIGNFFIVHGDRHWQYHSVDPLGVEEFSVGAIDATNARMPRLPGDAKSTDPKGTIKQPFVANGITGGFLRIQTSRLDSTAVLRFVFYDQKGKILYELKK